MTWIRTAGIVLVLGLIAGLVAWALEAQDRARQAGLARDAAEAMADTVRRERDALDQDLTITRLRAVQQQQDRDSLDDQLRQERRVSTGLRFQVAVLSDSVEGLRDTSSVIPRATFHVRQIPFTIDAAVTIPDPPALPAARFQVALDSADLTVRVGCGPVNAVDQVRPVEVAVRGPTWLRVGLMQPTVDPLLCNPRTPLTDLARRLAPRPRQALIYGAAGAVLGGAMGWLVDRQHGTAPGAAAGGVIAALVGLLRP